MDTFTIPHLPKPITCARSSPASQPPTLIFTHGAGGTLASPGIADFAAGYAAAAPVACFQGGMNLASRVKAFSAVVASLGPCAALGGRSMGARAAVLAASRARADDDDDDDDDGDDADADGAGSTTAEPSKAKHPALVLASYPLIGPKDTRDAILLALPATARVLFLTGACDAMCPPAALAAVRARMPCRTWAVVVRGADHGMSVVPRAGTGPLGRRAGRVAAEWVAAVAQSEAAVAQHDAAPAPALDEARTAGALWWDAEGQRAVWSGWKRPGELESEGDVDADDDVADPRGAEGGAEPHAEAGAPERSATDGGSGDAATKVEAGARRAGSRARTSRPAADAEAPAGRATTATAMTRHGRKTKAKRERASRDEAPPPAVRRSKRLKAR